MATNPLTVELFGGWKLANPLWVASADLSHNEAGIKNFADLALAPGAVTLKTTAPLKRTDFAATKKYTLHVRTHRDPFEPRPRAQTQPTIYCDGPPDEEYLSIERTRALLKFAKSILPKTKIGISVLMGEEYQSIATELLGITDFAELNLKYAARMPSDRTGTSFLRAQGQLLQAIVEQIEEFASVFPSVPVFIKLTRELGWLSVECEETKRMVELLLARSRTQQIGLIVANTRKQRVPNDLISNVKERRERDDLSGGIVAGEHLYIETYNLVRSLTDHYPALCASVPIIATGGITTLSALLELMRAGAKAAQVYTALNAYGPDYLVSLCTDLTQLIHEGKFSSYERLFAEVQRDPKQHARELALLIPMRNRLGLREKLKQTEQRAIGELLERLRSRLGDSVRAMRSAPAHATVPGAFETAATVNLPSLEMCTEREGDVTVKCAFEATVLSAASNVDANIVMRFADLNNVKLHLSETSRAEDVLRNISDGSPWDLALLSAPYVKALSPAKDASCTPVLLGHFFEAEYILGGFGTLSKATDVYNFGGLEAAYILDAIQPELRVEITRRTVKTDAVLLWLHSERDRITFLAKDPIFTAYRMLSPSQSLKQLHRIALPIYLVASKQFCTRIGENGLRVLYRSLICSLDAASDTRNSQRLRRHITVEAWKNWTKYLGIPEGR